MLTDTFFSCRTTLRSLWASPRLAVRRRLPRRSKWWGSEGDFELGSKQVGSMVPSLMTCLCVFSYVPYLYVTVLSFESNGKGDWVGWLVVFDSVMTHRTRALLARNHSREGVTWLPFLVMQGRFGISALSSAYIHLVNVETAGGPA